ncbi:Endonuclease-reverse transcriptase [Popillia japonica]|uniref:Endonuclease-reverse transcriptase n=1 Tax=Popillia japonica TaxID=7064 RepID=A0AAW1L7G2_POPJA
MRILQTNLGRGRAALNLAFATAKQSNIDILIISEPNKNIVRGSEWIKDRQSNVAILFTNKKVEVKKVEHAEGYVYLRINCGAIYCCYISPNISMINCGAIYCCYISPNISMREYEDKVDEIMCSVRRRKEECIILGDINSKSIQWGSPIPDKREKYWTEWMSTLNLVVHNTGMEPTFVRGLSQSYIDVTCSTQKLAKTISEWKVLENETLTEHAYIYFEIKGTKTPKNPAGKESTLNDWGAFCTRIKQKASEMNPQQQKSYKKCTRIKQKASEMNPQQQKSYKKCTEVLNDVYIGSIAKGISRRSPTPYWWNATINEKRTACIQTRRKLIEGHQPHIGGMLPSMKNGLHVYKPEENLLE